MGEGATCDLPTVSKSGEFHSIGPRRGVGNISSCGTGVPRAWLDPDWLAATLAALADSHQVPGAQLAVHHAGVTVAAEYGELEYERGFRSPDRPPFPWRRFAKWQPRPWR